MLYPQYNYSVISLFCHTGFKRRGPIRVHCNGTHWDQPLGLCIEVQTFPVTSCDFESEEWCEWSQDATKNFLWKRSNGISKHWSIAVGPSHDHTTGLALTGFYMYLDMSEGVSDEAAHLISPSYSANYSSAACFRLFYHMYGLTPGTLNVYTKPVSVELEDALRNSSYRILEVKGNQGNRWNEKIVQVPLYKEDFHIVIEGISSYSYASHIAIDDVALLNGDDCTTKLENTDEETGGTWATESCSGRCTETNTTLNGRKFTVSEDGKITKKCDCFYDCESLSTCCPDYGPLCSIGKFLSKFALTIIK